MFILILMVGLSATLLWLLALDAPELFPGFSLGRDTRLVFTVVVAGALGASIHVATSFSDYVGNNQYKSTWRWWYLLRPAMGASLALIFYCLLRGGILTLAGETSGSPAPSPFATAAIAALVGMFSKQATDKLDDVFDTLFKTEKDAERKDGLENPLPVITALDPASSSAGLNQPLEVTVAGTGFVSGSKGSVNGIERPTKFESKEQLKITLRPEDLAKDGVLTVTVSSPAPGGGLSNGMPFVVGPDGDDDGQIPSTWFGEKLFSAEKDDEAEADEPVPADGAG